VTWARAGGLLLLAAACAVVLAGFHVVTFLVATLVWLACIRSKGMGARWLLFVALGMRVVFLASDAHSDDVHRYVWEGRVQLAGHSPYAHAPADPALASLRTETHGRINHPQYPTIYPPLTQALFVSAAAVGLGEVGLKNLVLLLDCGVVLLLVAWLRASGRPVAWAALYAWSPIAVAASASGHADALMLLPLVGFLWAAERRAWAWAAVLLGLAILAKVVAVLLVPWLLARRPRLVLLGVVPVVLAGYLPYAAAGNVLGSLTAFGSDFAFNASLFRAADAVLPGEGARAVVAATLALWTAFVAYGEPRPARAAVLVFAGLLALSPTVHAWYVTWFLVALPGVGPRLWSFPFVAWAASVTATLPVYLASRAGEPFVEDFRWTAVEYLGPAALLAWLAWARRPQRKPLETPIGGAPGTYAVVVPARRERDNLALLLPRWMETSASEVVVADTPTGDGTEDLVRRFPRARYLAVNERGYGAAVAAGWREAAPSDFLVVCDADYVDAPDHADRLLAPMSDPRVGLVTGARTDGRLPFAQRCGNRLATFLIGLFWGRRFHDLGPFRALRRRSLPVDAMRDRAFGWNVEMNVRALQNGVEVVEVAVPSGRRTFGRDRIGSTLRGILGAGRGILARIRTLREESCTRPS
jgi:hypothetical protein